MTQAVQDWQSLILGIRAAQPAFSSAVSTSTASSSAKQVLGALQFDQSRWPPGTPAPTTQVFFRAILAAVGGTCFVDIYDADGVTNNGVPTTLASAQLSTTSSTPAEVSVELPVFEAPIGAGLLQARIWASSGATAICQGAILDITYR